MKTFNNKSGFTLIEIIVVLIIVGILAAIALPNLFSNIQKSKSGQALASMDSFKTAFESCLASNGTTAANVAPCTFAGQNLTSTAGIWGFTLTTATVAQTAALGNVTAGGGTFQAGTLAYSIVASDGTNSIVLNRAAAGTWTCSTGTGSPYTGVC